VIENKVLMKIFGRKRDEVTVIWRKLRHEERHTSPDIMRMINERAYSTHGEMKSAYSFFYSLKGRDHSEDLGADGRIILKFIVGK
jgi:hypothetical protein